MLIHSSLFLHTIGQNRHTRRSTEIEHARELDEITSCRYVPYLPLWRAGILNDIAESRSSACARVSESYFCNMGDHKIHRTSNPKAQTAGASRALDTICGRSDFSHLDQQRTYCDRNSKDTKPKQETAIPPRREQNRTKLN